MSTLTKAEFHRPGSDQHIYIATPATAICSNFHVSLVREIPRLISAGHGVTYSHLAGCCHVDDARNLLVDDFLSNTKATDMLFWDADVAAEPGAAVKLASHDTDIVGGVYPYKDGSKRFPARLTGVDLDGGLSVAQMMPTGFLRIRRHVMIQLAYDAAKARLDGRRDVAVVFERTIVNGERVSGDANFCIKAAAQGHKVLCDPSILFTHQGAVDFRGRLSDYQGDDL